MCYSNEYRTTGLILARRKADEPCQDGNVAAISLYLRVLQDRHPGRYLAIGGGVRLFYVQILTSPKVQFLLCLSRKPNRTMFISTSRLSRRASIGISMPKRALWCLPNSTTGSAAPVAYRSVGTALGDSNANFHPGQQGI